MSPLTNKTRADVNINLAAINNSTTSVATTSVNDSEPKPAPRPPSAKKPKVNTAIATEDMLDEGTVMFGGRIKKLGLAGVQEITERPGFENFEWVYKNISDQCFL